MIWSWLIALLACLTPGSTFYHMLSERIFSEVKSADANFGFSVSSVSMGKTSKLVVGAPLADTTGDVYTCDLSAATNTCTPADKSPIVRFKDNANYTNLNYWFGASVMGTNNMFVACSPLLIDKDSNLFTGYPVGTFGRCLKYTNGVPTMLPTISQAARKEKFEKFEETMDSFGWSLYIDSDNSILIGGPAVISGRMLKVKSTTLQYVKGESTRNSFNFGYAVASAKFLHPTKHSITVGSTYGTHGKGMVSFFMEHGSNLNPTRKSIEGPEVGFNFGAALCYAVLQSSGQNSLLVGAPTYGTNDGLYNLGAVYVYNAQKGTPILKNKIVGNFINANFGTAIVSLGDLNHDMLDEIAIGAPYENDGRGAVYVYSGANILKDGATPLQTITPSEKMKTYGYSLSVIRDYDDNGCNELAIGVPANNSVVVLRCVAGITIELMKFPKTIEGNDGKDKTIPLDLCVNAKFREKPSEVVAVVAVTVKFEHLGVDGDKTVTFHINKKQEKYCEKIDLIMKKNGDFNKEIKYVLSAVLKNDPLTRSNFKGSDVILNNQNDLSVSGYIWAQDCGNKICVPDLHIVKFNAESPYKLGSSESINATVWVTNERDVAYDACLLVTVTGARVPRPLVMCEAIPLDTDTGEELSEVLLCKPKQLLRKGSLHWQTDIVLNTTLLTNENRDIKVKVEVYNECESKKVTATDTKVIELLADDGSVKVHGRVDDGLSDIVNLTRTDIAQKKSFEHVYTISNSGQTKWVNIPIAVKVENQDFVTKSVHLDDQTCDQNATDATNADFYTYSCWALKLDSDASIDVKVRMQVVSDEISDRIDKETLTVYSQVVVDMDGMYKTANVTSVLRLEEVSIPIWIIIVASILALIILLIIFFIMRECGVFERKNKTNLMQAKKSVRRQTIMRESMRHRPRSEDHERLVTEASASQDSVNQYSMSQDKPKKERRVVISDF